MPDAFRLLLSASAMGTASILVTQAVKKLFGKKLSPKVHMIFWIPVILRLIVPYTPATPFSVYNYIDVVPADALAHIHPSNAPLQFRLLPVIWFIGAFFFVLFTAVSYLQFVKKLCILRQADEKTIMIAQKAAETVSLKKQPEIVFCENRISPMVVGFFRPRLVLPLFITESLEENQLFLIFLHEYTHIKRKDALLNLLLIFVGCLHWFNPFVYLMRSWVRRDSELACDDDVLTKYDNAQTHLYGKTILDLLECTVHAKNALVCAPMADTKKTVKNRLQTLYTVTRKKLAVIALPFCLILSVTLLTGAIGEELTLKVGEVTDLLDPVIIIPPIDTPVPSEIPSAAPSEDSEPTSEPSDLPSDTPEATPTATAMPSPSAAATPSSATTPKPIPSTLPSPESTPSAPTPISATVHTYQTKYATAKFSKDRTLAGFTAQIGETQITTVGIRTATDDRISGFFTITKNGEVIAENIPGTVRANGSEVTFSSTDNVYRYTFPVISVTTT